MSGPRARPAALRSFSLSRRSTSSGVPPISESVSRSKPSRRSSWPERVFFSPAPSCISWPAGRAQRESSWAEWRTALVVGACLLFFGNGGVTLAEQWVPSGLASLLVATVPIYIALLAWLSGAAPRPRPLVMLGLAGGFIGVGLLVSPALSAPLTAESRHTGLGMLILLLGSLI